MATRQTTLITKHSIIPSQTLPVTGNLGEGLVNLGDGILFFSGGTSGSPTWVQSNNPTSGYFEVGSNLYDLKIRNQITSYSGVTNLTNMFLSGTSTGFVLAPISGIVGVDTYPTGFTYNSNVFTITQNVGGPTLTALFNTVTGLTVSGTLSAITGNISTINTDTLNATGGTVTTLGTTTANVATLNATAGTVTTLNSTTISGVSSFSATSISAITATTTDLYLNGAIKTYGGAANVSGQFLSGTTNGFVLEQISAITGIDSYVTGFTYTAATNTINLYQNNNGSNWSTQIQAVSGLTVNDLGTNKIVYSNAASHLATDTEFSYDASLDLMTVGNINATNDVTIYGSLTVFGPSISAFTSELYVEDKNITMNYNPTGSTSGTSLGAGWTIQDGNGVASGDVNFQINKLDSLTGLTVGNTPDVTEYIASTGYANRGFITQLNDIVIRSTNVSTPNGVRVLAEFDILDGGSY
jgi:hypothetical protein